MIRVRDLQFAKYFLEHEIDINPAVSGKLLNFEVVIKNSGVPNTCKVLDGKVIVYQPSSLTRFLFSVLYNLIKNYVNPGIQQDKLGLGLLFACKDYTYGEEHTDKYCLETVPVILTKDKISIIPNILKNIIEPLIGKVRNIPIMFMKTNCTDACEIIDSPQKFSEKFQIPFNEVSFHDYPFILVNSSLHNEAAQYAHLIHKILIHSFGEDHTNKLIKNILLSQSGIMSYILTVLKIERGDPLFIMDFLKFFESNVYLNEEEQNVSTKIRQSSILSDNYLKDRIKIATNQTPHVFKQWSQWSLLVGLIEKQLQPMRGSMWPASENIKPVEDKHRQMEAVKAKEKGKTQLNFEELLELSREWYGHKAVNPGQLAETLLKENRVWK